ncbi:Ig-like domain-containing domain [Gelidibacter salicanalis]|uniref:Ig-like domain-containing protein n=1 Tax=Gelidibacter salicanalis TaxID=291193 RepID=A0A934NHP5_9FLAO|nr:Ig-like domain-containing domain [Gelidibacter salicanalis]MBJ7880048.1 Ig-like domain-containing protein [Gelidibacter salicanalis]
MFKSYYKLFLFFGILVTLVNCANRGTPSGGEKDTQAPRIVRSSPENYTTNFKGTEIKIYFDEYIKIKNVQKQLIISPPMDPQPDVFPLGSASKFITIKINDTLQANTTYAFNFGQSIVDNNEENPYSYYKYVLSTGNYIDSLSVKGAIIDAEKREPEKFVTVMLYEVDSTYSDSTIYKKQPKYVTNTLDSVSTFSIDNIKAGKYRLVALKDENGNYTYQQKSDKIGFYDKEITVPTDSFYEIKLFKEIPEFKVERPLQVAKQKIEFGFRGDYKNTSIEMMGEKPSGFEHRILKDSQKDTLYYWYKPNVEMDTTYFVVKNNSYTDTLKHRFRDLKVDSLNIKPTVTGAVNFDDDFSIEANVPLELLDESKVTIIDKDSVSIAFRTEFDTLKNRFHFKFDKTEANAYKIEMLPTAITDFFGTVNDTLRYEFKTKKFSELSDVRVTLIDAVYPVIVQLTDDKGVVKYEQYAEAPRLFDFRHINPSNYYLRVVYDSNGNRKWDTGGYLKKVQPERISYYTEQVEARAGWDTVYTFTLLKTDPDPIEN